ncbi:ribonuclease H-like protein [Wallemia mellicola]|uniref:Synaptobrevin homolog YKT6 n=1 Tax=Wallemia mellicola TaxID=1708541 RepID=A0A4T0M783_9BASI|nr:ribonuclease H-like protein [Wallemia mellicola]
MPVNRSRSSNLSSEDKPLVWVDLEMTGLDMNNDHILEIAIIITDGELNKVDDGISLIVKRPKTVLDNMNEWCISTHGLSGLTKQVLTSPFSHQTVSKVAYEYIKRWIPDPRISVIAGNTVHMDLRFLEMDAHKEGWSRIASHLGYRVVDVSSFKEIAARWYPTLPLKSKKTSKHRALDDVQASIDELKYYRQSIFKPTERSVDVVTAGAFDSAEKPAINIQQCDDLGSFSFYQRSSVREFLVFMAKTVAERTENGQRQSVQENNYTAHVYRQAVAIVTEQYPVRPAFSLLQKVLDAVPGAVRTTATYSEWVDGIRKGNNTTQSPVVLPELNTLIMKYQDPKQADTIMRVQQELDETKVVMHKTIESVLERGEKLDNLVERSNALSAQSKMFYKTAKKQNSCCVIS